MREAARKTDGTEHGGVVKQGSPDVMINGLPAARLSDYHTCPSDTEGYVHVGGPICEGASTVTINGLMMARKGDHLVCGAPEGESSVGGAGGAENPSNKPKDKASVKHAWKPDPIGKKEKTFGKKKLDERRGPKKFQKKPIFKFKGTLYDLGQDKGELYKFWGDHGKLGAWDYRANVGSADIDIRSIKDFRGSLNVVDAGASFTGAKLETGKGDIGIGTVKGELDVLKVKADAKLGAEIDTKKKQFWAGASGGIGGSVVEGKASVETDQIKIPFTNWGIKIQAEGKGSLLTAEAEGHAGVRYDKKGFSARVGGKVGALIAGLGFDFGISIGPMEPPTIPKDTITNGSSDVFVGD